MALTIKINKKYLDNSDYSRPKKRMRFDNNITKKLTINIIDTFSKINDNYSESKNNYIKNLIKYVEEINKVPLLDIDFSNILKIQFIEEISSESKKLFLKNINEYLEKNNICINLNNNYYKFKKYLGQGVYSLVFEIENINENKSYAIKIFNYNYSIKFVKKEINFLQKLNDYEYFINIKDFKHDENKFQCVVMEKMKYNLFQLLIGNEKNYIPIKLIFHFMKMLLNCLKTMKQNNIIHTDLKPENIMINSYDINQILNENLPIKIIDFSLSIDKKKNDYDLITYLQSRYYRSIETCMRHEYSYSMDLWSVGCILFEMYTKFPLFSSQNEFEHIVNITNAFGLPSTSMIESFKLYFKYLKEKKFRTGKFDIYNKIIDYFQNYNDYNVKNSPQNFIKNKIKKYVINNETNTYEFDALCYIISNMLNLNPSERITIDEALCICNLIIEEYLD